MKKDGEGKNGGGKGGGARTTRGAFLPFLALVHGAKMAMLTLFFWRYLARRHAASFWTKQAVDILVERVRDLGKHRFVPAPVGGLLDAVVSTLSKVFAKLR